MQGVKSRLLANPPQPTLDVAGAEAVLNLLTLSLQRHDPQDPLDAADRAAIKSLWESQVQEGPAKGSWEWVTSDLDPMDSVRATYYGATLAARALSVYPTESADRVDALRNYLKREAPKQPLHHRMGWIAFNAKHDEESKSAVLKDLWAAQSGDGGWSTAALGPWPAREKKPADSGSSAYATAWAAFTAREAGVSCSDTGLKRATRWLAQHQDPATGAWNSVSMNKGSSEGLDDIQVHDRCGDRIRGGRADRLRAKLVPQAPRMCLSRDGSRSGCNGVVQGTSTPKLRQQRLHHAPVYIGQPEMAALILVGKPRMIHAEALHNGGVQIMHMHRI